MKNTGYSALIAVVITLFSSYNTYCQETFHRTYGRFSLDQGRQLIKTSDGGYVITGIITLFNGNGDMYLIKLDANFDTLWTRAYGGASAEGAVSVNETTDGGLFVFGGTSSFGEGNSAFYAVRTDGNGDTLWTRTYGGYALESSSAAQQTSSGGFLMVGSTTSYGQGSGELYMVNIDANGDSLWSRTYGENSASETANALLATSDGGQILVGQGYNTSTSSTAGLVIKLDAAGDKTWARKLDASVEENAYAVAETNDGGFQHGHRYHRPSDILAKSCPVLVH